MNTLEILRKKLYSEAERHEACAGREDILAAKDLDALAMLYFRHIDFCFLQNYPSRKLLNRLSAEINQRGILLSGGDMAPEGLRQYALLNDSRITVNLRGRQLTSVYAKDAAAVSVKALDNSICAVVLRGRAVVDVVARNDARVIVRLRDDARVVACTSDKDARIIIVK
jgi:hypothetical protein